MHYYTIMEFMGKPKKKTRSCHGIHHAASRLRYVTQENTRCRKAHNINRIITQKAQ